MWYYCQNCSALTGRHVFMYIVGGQLQMSCGNCGTLLVRSSPQAEDVINSSVNKNRTGEWQQFSHNAVQYSCILYSAMTPIGYSNHLNPITAPQIGPQLPQKPMAPTRTFSNKNQVATSTEVLIGKYLAFELESEGVKEVICASELKNTRSGDYRLIYSNGTVLPADLYECNTNNTLNVASYIQSKWDQADTIVVLLPNVNSPECEAIIKQIQPAAVPASNGTYVVPRRLLFIRQQIIHGLPEELCFQVVKDHKFFDKPQDKLFTLQK